ncbi:aldo/keto reductase [soil metagenome]
MSTSKTITVGGKTISRVGLGTNRLENTSANREFLSGAVNAGIGMIDSAHLYTSGESEKTIGAALAPFADDLVIATKGGFHSGAPEKVRAEIEQSLESLNTETIGLWYLHRVDDKVPVEETLGAVKEFVDAGRIEHVGLSQVDAATVELGASVLPIAAVQNGYNLDEREYDSLIDHCEKHEIAFVPFFPLRGGDKSQLEEIGRRYEISAQQVKLAWLLRRSPAVLPIPGTLHLDHLKGNLATLDVELTDEDYAALWPA